MTRKDYEQVARIIREEVSVGKAVVAMDFARAFERENSGFDRDKFLKAAGATNKEPRRD